jgi:hypothetical protein
MTGRGLVFIDFDKLERVVIEEEGIPVFDFRSDQIVGRVPVNRKNRDVIHDGLLGLRENGHSGRDV